MAIQKGGQNCSITSFALNFQTFMAQILAIQKISCQIAGISQIKV